MEILRYLLFIFLLISSSANSAVIYTLEGRITGVFGDSPSLNNLNLSFGDYLSYKILIDFNRRAFWTDSIGNKNFREDRAQGDEVHDFYYAELLASSYIQPFDAIFSRTSFVGENVFNGRFYNPSSFTRLFIGNYALQLSTPSIFPDWDIGTEVGSWNFWQDIETNSNSSFFGRLAITNKQNVPEPSTFLLMGLGLLVIAYTRRKNIKLDF